MAVWTLMVKFETGGGRAFHIGSGYGYAGRIDRRLLRDVQGLPYVPGSTLKGKLRHAAREVAAALGYRMCREYCLPQEGQVPCAICRVFGSPFLEGKLFLSDASCAVEENPALGVTDWGERAAPRIWDERDGVAIDRKTRTARPGHLFRTECAPAGLKLRATLTGDLDEETEVPLLRAAVKTLGWLGADSSRGLGGCRCELL
jgi:CRISPR/Cas system CSM-associated protein Csm3 (group 7 of RAMP superfamily)